MNWTVDQWVMFCCFTVAGLAGLGLIVLTVHGRRQRRIAPPPWMTINERRALAGLPPAALVEAVPFNPPPGWDDLSTAVPLTDELVREHLAHGPGSLASLRAVGDGQLITITHADLVDPETEREVGAALDALLDSFRVATEPAMRKARLWMLQGRESYAAAELRRWRIESPTGELPVYLRPDVQRAAAEAALVAL